MEGRKGGTPEIATNKIWLQGFLWKEGEVDMKVDTQKGSGQRRRVSESQMRQSYKIYALFLQISESMTKARENELRPYGITMMQSAVLFQLKQSGQAVSPAMIARYVLREPNTVSELLARMEKQGLVRQTRNSKRDPEDKSLIGVELTEKGEEIFLKQTQERKVIPQIIGSLTAKERKTLQDLLFKVRGSTLEALSARPKLLWP